MKLIHSKVLVLSTNPYNPSYSSLRLEWETRDFEDVRGQAPWEAHPRTEVCANVCNFPHDQIAFLDSSKIVIFTLLCEI